MLYPVYVHVGNQHQAHGITIPDFPGCVSTAGSWEGLTDAIQMAVERYVEQTGMEVPQPTPLEKLALDPAYQGGVWMLIEVNVSRFPRAPRSSTSDLKSVLSSKVPPHFLHDAVETIARQELTPQEADKGELPEPEAVKKVELALPEDLLRVIDDFADAHNLNRSAVIARAALKFVADKKE